MRMLNAVIASSLFHILLLGALLLLWPDMRPGTAPPFFHVTIAEPPADRAPVRETVKTARPPQRRPHKKPAEKTLPPDALHDSGAEDVRGASPPDGSGDADRSGTGDGYALRENNAPLHPAPGASLFDRDIIEKYAKKETRGDKNLTFDVPEFHHRGYMRMLREKIEGIWKYPGEAAMLGISGDLYIRFSIRRDGTLGNISLLRTSGYQELDEAAIRAIRDAEPYWPLPAEWEKDDLTITGHFIYVIGGSYIL